MNDGFSSGPFRIRDAHEICIAPYLADEQRREAARLASDRAEAQRGAGVGWSGLGAPSRSPRTAEEIRAAAEAALTRAERFAESPRGRFLRSLCALERRGYGRAADTARGAFARGFADPDRAPCIAELGVALTALARLDEPDARAGCLALAELLGGALGMAAA